MTGDRWDTSEHRDDEPRRQRPDGRTYGPWHDVTMMMDGAAAKAIAAGVDVSYYEADGNIHGFATYRRAIPSSQGDLDQIMALARTYLGTRPVQ